jgi:hypothetical protein
MLYQLSYASEKLPEIRPPDSEPEIENSSGHTNSRHVRGTEIKISTAAWAGQTAPPRQTGVAEEARAIPQNNLRNCETLRSAAPHYYRRRVREFSHADR